jgi:type III secretion protein F
MLDTSSAVTFSFINNTVATALNQRETTLRDSITKVGAEPSSVQLLDLQQQVQQWTLMVSIQSTMAKQVGDSMREVIQKAG